MIEKRASCIENDIVVRLLLFLYTDILEDLQWETAIKLYCLADKYQVGRLNCSYFLIDNIKASNASDILPLSDIHQDSDLKKHMRKFILQRHVEIFSPEERYAFAKSNSQLALDTMVLIYATKEVKLK
ncbi:hypothetical protein AVEN_231042-1 [Araneus ventricosus]|uniref:BTB domain-containing protein n=1 Tax=Araneus ventricosus TaxID=182803 RepID=A0A4Y2A5E2_ARAVE|nr:hypothetical protein AVEN_231042-1 [Araneus ventricosus]